MPAPARKEGESKSDYRSRLIKFFVKEGREINQAQAMAYSMTETKAEKKAYEQSKK